MRRVPSAGSVRAFTLVELLAVLAIIALLVAILLPVFAKAREQANQIKCAANLRNIGLALIAYAQQTRYYPACSGVIDGDGIGVAVWPVRLRPFLAGQQRVFECPSEDEQCEWSDTAPGNVMRATAFYQGYGYEVGERLIMPTGNRFSYGYNFGGANSTSGSILDGTFTGLGYFVGPDLEQIRRRGELPTSKVRLPAEMIAIADSSPKGVHDFALSPYASTPIGHPGRIHNRGANVLFCDGHVQWYPQSDVLITDGSDPSQWRKVRMWNNDHSLSPWQ